MSILLLLSLFLLTACSIGSGTAVEPLIVDAPAEASEIEASDMNESVAEESVAKEPESAEPTVDEASTDEDVANETVANETVASVADETVAEFSPDSVALQLRLVTSGLTSPVFVTHAGDGSGRIFIVEQPGRVRVFEDGQLYPVAFLDIADRVRDSSNEQGLLGLAFAPDYASSGIFYVNYTNAQGDTTVSRFQRSTGDANLADPASESIVLSIAQPAGNHNGGMIAFGPDGYLYIGTGDGGAANDRFGNGQNPRSLLGKMLRIDVAAGSPYSIPADNPWVSVDWQGSDGAVDVLDEIWSVGLRNPWRFSFDRATNDLWIGDVGQNKFEEIHFTSGSALVANSVQPLNYGWPIMEGFHCFSPSRDCNMSGLVQPVAEYGHSGHCSVTGGYVYRGARFPQIDGVYFYGDFCSGVVWAMWPQADNSWGEAEVMKSGTQLSSFGEDEAGELYITDRSGSVYLLTAQ